MRVAPASLILSCILLQGCSVLESCCTAAQAAELDSTIYVIRRSWHTRVAIAASDWPNHDWPVLRDFPEVEYLEFGWGDERFYKAERNTLWLGSRAAFWPTASTIHAIGLQAPLVYTARADGIVELRITKAGLRQLARSIEQEFAHARPAAEGPQLAAAPAPNHFYPGKRRFFFPRMCNWWIAVHLRAAGCPIRPWSIVTAAQVMRRARGFAHPACHASAHIATRPPDTINSRGTLEKRRTGADDPPDSR